MMGEQSQTSREERSASWSFLDLPQEVKDNVYQKYFEDNKQNVTLFAHERIFNYDQLPHTELTCDEEKQVLLWEPQEYMFTMSLLVACRAVYAECLPQLYKNKTFRVERENSFRSLPPNVVSGIRELDISGMGLIDIIAIPRFLAGTIEGDVWATVMVKMPYLRRLTLDCDFDRIARVLYHVAGRAVYLSDETQLFLEVRVHGRKRDEPMAPISVDDERCRSGGPYAPLIPPVNKFIIVMEASHQERMLIHRLDLGNHRLRKLCKRSVGKGRFQHTYRLEHQNGHTWSSTSLQAAQIR